MQNDVSTAWAAAYNIFGGIWNGRETFHGAAKPPSLKKVTKYPSQDEISPLDNVDQPKSPPKAKITTNPYYIEKPPPAPPKGKAKKTWKHVTFLKGRLSSYWDSDKENYGQAMTNMLTEWGGLVDILLNKDPHGTVLLPWSDTD